jgi:hypothetical protein
MRTDVLFLCHGRLEFTVASLENLIARTDWSLVNEFVVYHDAANSAYDGASVDAYLDEMSGAEMTLRRTNLQSPVAVMNHFMARSQAELFAKVDNDIIVPDGWLEALLSMMEANPRLDLLGMEAGMSGQRAWALAPQTWTPSSHIGGVGLMRRTAFDVRPPLIPNGRFGFTEWQHDYEPVSGWIEPDLRMFALDQLPIEPWNTLTETYRKKGLNREWSQHAPSMSYYWNWWLECT